MKCDGCENDGKFANSKSNSGERIKGKIIGIPPDYRYVRYVRRNPIAKQSKIGALLKKNLVHGPSKIWAMWTKFRRKTCRGFGVHGLLCDGPNPVSQNGPWTKHAAQTNTSCVGEDTRAR